MHTKRSFLCRCARYVYNCFLSLDQLGNSILAGDPDETISSRLGRITLKHNGRIPWSRPLARITAAVLNRLQKNHCINAIEHGHGHNGLLDAPTHTRRNQPHTRPRSTQAG